VAVREERAKLLKAALGAEADRVRFLPIEEVGRNPARMIVLWRDFVEASGGKPGIGIGESVWAGRSRAALDECHRHEALLNLVFASSQPWSLLCPYDAQALPDEELEIAARTHRLISREGRTEESAAFEVDPDSLSGELPRPTVRPDTLSFGIAELSEVRRRATAAAERAGQDPSAVADLVTAVSELAANSVMHGGGTGTLRLWREDGSLLAEVEDEGRIEEQLVGRLRPDVSQEGGRGLWLANQLCDLVQIRSGERGTVVRLHVPAGDRAQGSQAPPAASDPRGDRGDAQRSNA
jgi:anti-sigma regulatory factor (Ser/Thr protein kinase)